MLPVLDTQPDRPVDTGTALGAGEAADLAADSTVSGGASLVAESGSSAMGCPGAVTDMR